MTLLVGFLIGSLFGYWLFIFADRIKGLERTERRMTGRLNDHSERLLRLERKINNYGGAPPP